MRAPYTCKACNVPLKGHQCPKKQNVAYGTLEVRESMSKRKRPCVIDDDDSDEEELSAHPAKGAKKSHEESVMETIRTWSNAAKECDRLSKQLVEQTDTLKNRIKCREDIITELKKNAASEYHKLEKLRAEVDELRQENERLAKSVAPAAAASSVAPSDMSAQMSAQGAHACLLKSAMKHAKGMNAALHSVNAPAAGPPAQEVQFTIDMSMDPQQKNVQPITDASVVSNLLTLDNSKSPPQTWKPSPGAKTTYAFGGHSYTTTVHAGGVIEQVNGQTNKKRIIEYAVVASVSLSVAPTLHKFLYEDDGMFDVPHLLNVSLGHNFDGPSEELAELAEEFSKLTGVNRKYSKNATKTPSRAWFKPTMLHAWLHAAAKFDLKQCRIAVHGVTNETNKKPMMDGAFMFNHAVAKPGAEGCGLYVALTDHLTQWHHHPGQFIIGLLLCDKRKTLPTEVAKYYNLSNPCHWSPTHPSGVTDSVIKPEQASAVIGKNRNAVRLKHDELFLPLGFVTP